MIQTYSTTIRRKEMDAVLTCMVDEKIGPGELNQRLIQQVKEFIKCDGCVALRSPAIALKYALLALDLEKNSKIMISHTEDSLELYLKLYELCSICLSSCVGSFMHYCLPSFCRLLGSRQLIAFIYEPID